MNTDLIKQLELALAVERGEVPWGELQIRRTDQVDQWADCTMKPAWQFSFYEYRRKPKALEKWLMFYNDNSARSFESFEEAKAAMEQEKNSYFTPVGITHMREVTNE